jgi:hypothetical protein
MPCNGEDEKRTTTSGPRRGDETRGKTEEENGKGKRE